MTLLADTAGEDTRAELHRRHDGSYVVVVRALAVGAAAGPRVLDRRQVPPEQARRFYHTSGATRHVEEAEAFPAPAPPA